MGMLLFLPVILIVATVFLFSILVADLGIERKNTISFLRRIGLQRAQLPEKILGRVASLNSKIIPEYLKDKTRKKLFLLRETVRVDVDHFLAAKEILAMVPGLVYPLLSGTFDFLPVSGLAVLGFFLPDIWLRDRIAKQHMEILRQMPGFLDLLTVCVEAGLNFESALRKILSKTRAGLLKNEFEQMLNEVKMGRRRSDAMKSMAKRIGLPEFSSFTASVIQAEKLGINIGQMLRVQTALIREKRWQRAEKLALEAPIKMLFPLIVFIFPTTFIMLFGPIILRLLKLK